MDKVEQVDRDAAYLLFKKHYGDDWPALRDGAWDEHEFIQAFAKHRLSGVKAGLEAGARRAHAFKQKIREPNDWFIAVDISQAILSIDPESIGGGE